MEERDNIIIDDQEYHLGHFDEFGQFKYNTDYSEQYINTKPRKKSHIDLKDLSEENFLGLIAAKN